LLGGGAKDYICSQHTEDELWDIMYTAHQKGHLLGCGTHGKGDDSHSHANGMAKSHAYAVLDMRFLDDVDEDGNKIVIRAIKLRNPWSKEKYNGKLSDKD